MAHFPGMKRVQLGAHTWRAFGPDEISSSGEGFSVDPLIPIELQRSMHARQKEMEAEVLAARKQLWSAKAPLVQAFIDDLAALFKKHGLYIDITNVDVEATDEPLRIIATRDGITTHMVTIGEGGNDDVGFVAADIPAPSAHDKLAVAKLRADILSAAKGGAK